jgi:hypothetical protein
MASSLVEPTDRATKIRPQGRLHDDRETWTRIGRDGSVAKARYDGCSQERGDAYLREAVRSYVAAYPHIFDRTKLAALAVRRMEAGTQTDKAVSTERTERGWLRQAGERHEAVIAFLRDVGVPMPACPDLPDPEQAAVTEIDEEATPAPLW